MRALRIYDGHVDDPEDVFGVHDVAVTAAGALTVVLDHNGAPGRQRGLIIAPGRWSRVEDWTTLPEPAPEPAPRPVPEPAAWQRADTLTDMPPVVDEPEPAPEPAPRHAAGSVPLPSETLGIIDPLSLSNAQRLREAMQVFCTCGRPAEHKPGCPRSPDRYNRHDAPCGVPARVDGVPMVGTGCVLPWDHTGPHDHANPMEAQPVGRATARDAAAGLTDRARVSAATALRGVGLLGLSERLGEALPGTVLTGLVEPVPVADPALRPDDSPTPDPGGWFRDRTVGDRCESISNIGGRCDRPAGHTDGRHAHTEPESGDMTFW